MIRIRRHTPAFVEQREAPPEFDCVDTAAVLALDWVLRWRSMDGFYRYSVSDSAYLMAELKGGDEFYVIGIRVSGEPFTGLPEWVETATARKRREEWNRRASREIRWDRL